MGYYTKYSLKWWLMNGSKIVASCEHEKPNGASFCPTCGKPVSVNIYDLVSQSIEKNSETFYAFDCNGGSRGPHTWYDHEDDMKRFSKFFPDVLFELSGEGENSGDMLSGEGENSGDIWRKYFLDGKMQIVNAKITFDDFDEEKLK